MEKDLEKRIQVLEDIEAIRQMKSMYVYAMDEKDWDAVLAYFSDDAKVDFGAFGKFEGKKAIEHFYKVTLSPGWSFTLHMTQDPIIEINGDVAKGIWSLHESSTFAPTNTAVWGAAKYKDDFVRKNGRWHCTNSLVTLIYLTPYDEGWAKTRIMI